MFFSGGQLYLSGYYTGIVSSVPFLVLIRCTDWSLAKKNNSFWEEKTPMTSPDTDTFDNVLKCAFQSWTHRCRQFISVSVCLCVRTARSPYESTTASQERSVGSRLFHAWIWSVDGDATHVIWSVLTCFIVSRLISYVFLFIVDDHRLVTHVITYDHTKGCFTLMLVTASTCSMYLHAEVYTYLATRVHTGALLSEICATTRTHLQWKRITYVLAGVILPKNVLNPPCWCIQ